MKIQKEELSQKSFNYTTILSKGKANLLPSTTLSQFTNLIQKKQLNTFYHESTHNTYNTKRIQKEKFCQKVIQLHCNFVQRKS